MLKRSAGIYRSIQALRTRARDPERWATTQANLANVLSMIGAKEPSPEVFDEAIAVNRALADEIGRDHDPDRWASLQNEDGYALTMAGRSENNVARFEEAVPILREAIAVQKKIASVPAVAFTEGSLCDVPTDLGPACKDRVLAQEAIAACQDALVIFRDREVDDLTAGSEKNLAEAQALLAGLN